MDKAQKYIARKFGHCVTGFSRTDSGGGVRELYDSSGDQREKMKRISYVKRNYNMYKTVDTAEK